MAAVHGLRLRIGSRMVVSWRLPVGCELTWRWRGWVLSLRGRGLTGGGGREDGPGGHRFAQSTLLASLGLAVVLSGATSEGVSTMAESGGIGCRSAGRGRQLSDCLGTAELGTIHANLRLATVLPLQDHHRCTAPSPLGTSLASPNDGRSSTANRGRA